MSERVIHNLAEDLGISLDQANSVWLKVRQAMFAALLNGDAIDLGMAYVTPTYQPARKRHNFGVNATVMVPGYQTLKIMVPPHARDALSGKVKLSPLAYMTRAQIKGLPEERLEEMRNSGLDFYRLKGVSA